MNHDSPDPGQCSVARPIIALLAALSWHAGTLAQSSAEPQHIDVIGVKAPLDYPYAKAHAAALKVREQSGGTVALSARLRDRAPPSAPPLRVTLEWDETVLRLPLDSLGRFVIPIDPQALQHNAVMTANRARKSVALDIDLVPVWHHPELRPADVRSIVEGGRAARASLLPWYARWITPTVNALRVCHVHARSGFEWLRPDSAAQTLTSTRSQDEFGREAWCIELDGVRDPLPEDAQLRLPPDSTLELTGSLI